MDETRSATFWIRFFLWVLFAVAASVLGIAGSFAVFGKDTTTAEDVAQYAITLVTGIGAIVLGIAVDSRRSGLQTWDPEEKLLQILKSRRPDSNRGPLHYE
jgi:hypothetical protein